MLEARMEWAQDVALVLSEFVVLAKDVLDVAQVALQVNVAKEGRRLPRSAVKELKALVE